MTVLLCSNGFTAISCVSLPSFSSSSSSSSIGSLCMAVTAAPTSRFSLKPTNLPPSSSIGFCALSRPVSTKKRSALGFMVSSDIPHDSESQSESDNDVMEELQLDAKLQNKLEKKLKMKVAKNVRLRRKKLVHKRRLRKKGRWPPSKMKKLSNV